VTSIGPRFGLVGAAGYIAPRHMEAMKKVGGTLAAAFDPSDSVGIIDRHFPEARFVTDFERFAEHVDKLKHGGNKLDYIAICSPNHLHHAHIAFALRAGTDAICEKPLVLTPEYIDDLATLESATGKRINTILQLRLHPAIIALRDAIAADTSGKVYKCDLTYITSRGLWYYESWKGDDARSGGIATNIGVHFFDMLSFVFGPLTENIVHHRAMDCAAGYLVYNRARVRWFLSINRRDISSDGVAHRSLDVKGLSVYDFSKGFEDLHTASYEKIVAGHGFPISEVRPSIETVTHIRCANLQPEQGIAHPMLERVRADLRRYVNGWPV
jgi:UDP-N-acetyl-2-amino-2-deoxyglucuronate dehydrogenase